MKPQLPTTTTPSPPDNSEQSNQTRQTRRLRVPTIHQLPDPGAALRRETQLDPPQHHHSPLISEESLSWVVDDPELRLDDRDIPYLGHTGIRVVLRRGGEPRAVAERAVTVAGVHGVMSFASRFFAGLEADIYLLSGATAETTLAARKAARYGEDAEIVLDAPCDAITPLDYSFAERIRASSLPAKLDTDQVM